MGVVVGTRNAKKSLGYVAEFCPVCRTTKVFQAFRVGRTFHIYYVPIGEGRLLGHIVQCQECGAIKVVNITKFTAFEKQGTLDVESLIQATYPRYYVDYGARLAIEKQLKQEPAFRLPQRKEWLMEPFLYLSERVEDRFANVRFDKESGMGCLGTILLIGLFGCAALMLGESDMYTAISYIGIIVVLIVGPIYTIIQLLLAPNRFIQRDVIPHLASALRLLKPSKEEVQQCLLELSTTGYKIGKKVNFEKLWAEIQHKL